MDHHKSNHVLGAADLIGGFALLALIAVIFAVGCRAVCARVMPHRASMSVVNFDLAHDWSYTVQHKAGSYYSAVSGYSAHYVYVPGALTFRTYSLSDANNANCTNCGIVLCK